MEKVVHVRSHLAPPATVQLMWGGGGSSAHPPPPPPHPPPPPPPTLPPPPGVQGGRSGGMGGGTSWLEYCLCYRDDNPTTGYINSSFVTEQISLSGKFRTALTLAITCLVFGKFQGSISIDSAYRPICSW